MLRLTIWLLSWVVAGNAVELPVGTLLCVRLTEPLSSDGSRADEAVQGMLAVPVELDGKIGLPARTPVSGRVSSVRPVGMGLRRDRAYLDIEITSIRPAGSESIPVIARVVAVENAREKAGKTGRIMGAVAADVPQVFFTLRTYQLPVLSPFPDPIRLLRLGVFPFFPQPEIRLPRGTDLWVRLAEPVKVPEARVKAPASVAVDAARLPKQVSSTKGKPADVVNLAFVGSQEELDEAFERSGWDRAHEPNWRTAFHTVRNVFAQRYDPYQPMSRMKLHGRVADRQYQRGLNTYSKRHHLRVWKTEEELGGRPVWVAAATHDIGIRYLWKRFHFTHAIDPKIDVERAKVAADLAFSGCVEDSELRAREFPGVLRNAEGARMETDGGVLALRLKPCEFDRVGSVAELAQAYKWKMPFWKKMLQRQVLIVRNDFVRLNVLWNGGRLAKRAVLALGKRDHRNPAETMIMPRTRWSPGTENVWSTSTASTAASPAGITASLSIENAPLLE